MAYEVTASRKRPLTFDLLVGQEFVATSLKKSVVSGKIAHAYLFSGPRGVGKTSAARILARAINCETWPAENPCGKCESCLSITRGNSLDVIEIDGASNTSVNDVREIRDEVLFAPNSSRYKIYIIDEVHMLSNSAFNALLKTIEEPPPYIVFIFATTEVHKVPATIKSRCQQFNFRLIDLETIRQKLSEASAESGIEAEDEALLWIAKEATGSLRDAYTLYDQIASFSEGKITISKIKEKLGFVGLDEINRLAESFADGSASDSLNIAGEMLGNGISPEQFVIELAGYFRNILFIKNGIRREGILGCPAERFSEKVVEKFSASQIGHALSTLLDLYRNLRYSLNQQFEIELAVSSLSFLSSYLSEAEMLEKIKALKNEVQNISVQSGAFAPETPAQPEGDGETENFTGYRDQLSAFFKKNNMLLATSLSKTSLWEKRGDKVKIYANDKFSADRIKSETTAVKKALDSAAEGSFQIEIVLPEREEQEADEQASEKVDLVKKIFKGEVVETRTIKDKRNEY